jgi:hypothetical protein
MNSSTLLSKRFIRNRKWIAPVLLARGSSTATSSSQKTTELPKYANQKYQHLIPVIVAAGTLGFAVGRQSVPNHEDDKLHLPNGLPRSCCDKGELTEDQKQLVQTLKRIVGKANILDGREENTQTSAFLKGSRLGHGSALCIVKPTKLKQVVEIVQAVVDANCVVLVQGQNTGLVRAANIWRQHAFGNYRYLNLEMIHRTSSVFS